MPKVGYVLCSKVVTFWCVLSKSTSWMGLESLLVYCNRATIINYDHCLETIKLFVL